MTILLDLALGEARLCLAFILIISSVFLFLRSIYRIFFHPLAHIPGPILPRITSLWLHYHTYVGDEPSQIHRLHRTHGPLVRVAPNEVDISDADAIAAIYISKGGFSKAPCYANFDIEGHKTIFSASNADYRNLRAKAVAPLFSTKALKENDAAIRSCVDRMVERLQQEAKTSKPINILNLTRSLAIDAVSTHLFHENYDGVSEHGSILSISASVDAFGDVGRFFYLPNLIFVGLDWAITKWQADRETHDSMVLVEHFVAGIVAKTTAKSTTFPGRLLDLGLSVPEVKAQCKDLVFAGTDTTGLNLATIIRNLTLYPETYMRLRKEVNDNNALEDKALDAQALPYLNAVVKEGLRVSMATPTRLPRTVPAEGWHIKNTFFPAGSIVGCSAYELHFNSSVFPDPRSFKPERWLDATEEMLKHWFAFGAGSRTCIARSLATLELQYALERLATSDALKGARVLQDKVEMFEWFNSKIKGEKIELIWS